MAHTHSVHDTDARFTINPITRAIKNESSRKTSLVQHDHNSERFSFELPRYIEGHDMMQCNQVQVHFINISATKEQKSGVYTVDDLQEATDGENTVVCSWLISHNATSLVGKLNFLLRFCCIEGGVVVYSWNTAVYSGVTISDGINADESFEAEYVDIIEKWKADAVHDITAEVN